MRVVGLGCDAGAPSRLHVLLLAFNDAVPTCLSAFPQRIRAPIMPSIYRPHHPRTPCAEILLEFASPSLFSGVFSLRNLVVCFGVKAQRQS